MTSRNKRPRRSTAGGAFAWWKANCEARVSPMRNKATVECASAMSRKAIGIRLAPTPPRGDPRP